MMKVEWNSATGHYHSVLLEDSKAWAFYHGLEELGLPAGIESMSEWECQQYLEAE